MTTLRWALGLVVTLTTAAFLALVIIGGGFRRSFGASDKSGPQIVIGLAVAGLVIASLVSPERRVLMHVVAVLMVAFAVLLLVIMRHAPFVASLGLLYAIGWFAFYYRAVWAPT